MRNHSIRILIGLVLLSAVSQQDFVPLVRLFALPFALVLYPFALCVCAMVLLAPFALAAWVLSRRYHDEKPRWVRRLARAIEDRLPPRLRDYARTIRRWFRERWPRRCPRECARASMRAGASRECAATPARGPEAWIAGSQITTDLP
jgi:hypothetical protein